MEGAEPMLRTRSNRTDTRSMGPANRLNRNPARDWM
jgi:hypothetical protein